MKIRALRNVGIDGKSVAAGEVVEVDDRTGRFLIGLGKAEAYVEVEVAAVSPPEKAVRRTAPKRKATRRSK
jgi:hypothetical protein